MISSWKGRNVFVQMNPQKAGMKNFDYPLVTWYSTVFVFILLKHASLKTASGIYSYHQWVLSPSCFAKNFTTVSKLLTWKWSWHLCSVFQFTNTSPSPTAHKAGLIIMIHHFPKGIFSSICKWQPEWRPSCLHCLSNMAEGTQPLSFPLVSEGEGFDLMSRRPVWPVEWFRGKKALWLAPVSWWSCICSLQETIYKRT